MLGASQPAISHPRSPEGCLGRAVKPKALEQGACVSCKKAPQGKMGPQGGVFGRQRLRRRMRQAEVRSCETILNAVSHPRRPLPSQKQPGLYWTGCKDPVFRAGCLYLSWKPSTSENRGAGWHGWATGIQGDVEAGREEKWQDIENAGSLPRTPLLSQKPLGLSWMGCRAPDFGAGCLCLYRKALTSKNRAARWRGWDAESQGDLEAGRGEKR